ncbi:hypothetical protein KFU94_42315 [Chloroflexi bacterium TSY]|nr:hypothetical protein [Chloroflexi bacterium TSY]
MNTKGDNQEYFLFRIDASDNPMEAVGYLPIMLQAVLLPWAFWPWQGSMTD